MSTPHIAGRYALYKEGNARIVRWLAKNAASCSAAFANVHLKDSISTSNLLRFANAIAESAVEIPGAILDLLADVIAGRQFCAKWYTAQATSDQAETAVSEQSIRSHSHFLEVLQQVYAILREARRSQRIGKHAAPASSELAEVEAKDSLPNLFAHLDVEEPSHSPLGAEPEPRVKTVDAAEASATNQSLELDDNAEKEFALWCLLEDLHDVRVYVRTTWEEFIAGELTFLAASAITDCAFGVMRRASQELANLDIDFAYLGGVLSFLGLEIRMIDKTPRLIGSSTQHVHDLDSKMCALICPSAAHTLKAVELVWEGMDAVSYTHLTLPTKRLV